MLKSHLNRFVVVMILSALLLLTPYAIANSTSLRVLTWSGSWYVPLVEKAIPEFEAAHPGVQIEIDKKADGVALAEAIVIENISGVTSDVLLLGSIMDNRWREIVSQDFTVDHLPYLERDPDINLEDFFPSLVEAFMPGDRLVGLPMETTTAATFVNKALFDEAGIAVPAEGWDWNDLSDTARMLTKRTNIDTTPIQWGFGTDGDGIQYLGASPFLWANGADVVNASKTEVTLLEPEAQEALEFFIDLHYVDEISVPRHVGNQWSMFWQGNLAIWDSATWNISYNRQNAQPLVDWDIVDQVTSPATGNPGTLVTGHTAAISAASDQPDLAWEFIKYVFLSDTGQMQVAAEGLLPSRTQFAATYVSTMESPPANLDPVLKAAATGRSPVWFDDPQTNKDVWRIIGEEWEHVLNQTQSVREFAEKVTPVVNRVLNAEQQ